jgi:hypothetical protein
MLGPPGRQIGLGVDPGDGKAAQAGEEARLNLPPRRL